MAADDELAQAMLAARRAARHWQAVPAQARARRLGRLRAIIMRRQEELVAAIAALTGKPRTEALLGEIYPVVSLLDYYQRHAAAILASQGRYTSPLLFPGSTATVHRQAYGVVAVISPWNYPLQLTMVPLLTALFAGNSVIFKPSELSAPVGEWILGLLAGLELPAGLVQAVYGDGETGRRLIAQRPDLICFTGSAATGRKVMAQAGGLLVPLLLELGGKDAMIVCADADWRRAAQAAVYGAFVNSGQVCVSVERCYVQRGIYGQFVEAARAHLRTLTTGADGDIGALTNPRQFEVVSRHYQDAIAKGARASAPLRLEDGLCRPVLLWDVDHGMAVMGEETFGPLLPVMPFTTEDEAVALANDSAYGLNASVWTANLAAGRRLGRRLRVGGFAINDVIKGVGHPGLPFGGVADSGFGRQRGPEGLLAYTYPVSELACGGQCRREPNWFPYNPPRHRQLQSYLDAIFGGGAGWRRLLRNWPAIWAMTAYLVVDGRQYWHNFKCLVFGLRR